MLQPRNDRSYCLPKGCKDLADVLKVASAKAAKARKRKPLETNEEIREILRKHVPELKDGLLEIVSTARVVGRRCLIVVRPSISGEVGKRTISLRRGPELNALIDELRGEFPTFSFWNESTEEFIRGTFLSPELRVTIHPSKAATVALSRKVFDATHRGVPDVQRKSQQRFHSEMVQLVSEVTGWKVSLEVAD